MLHFVDMLVKSIIIKLLGFQKTALFRLTIINLNLLHAVSLRIPFSGRIITPIVVYYWKGSDFSGFSSPHHKVICKKNFLNFFLKIFLKTKKKY